MRISIVTICFNAAATIADTLDSVAGQDWRDLEHIVVDGASSDGTMDIVRRRGHARLRAVSEPDEGIYDAMNKGLALATGDYVLFLNADDYLARPDSISIAARSILATGSDCIFGDTRFVDSGTGRLGRLYSARRFRPWWLRIGAMPPHPSMFMKRDLMTRLGGFDPAYRLAGDFDMVARAVFAAGASWTTLPEIITCFRTGGATTSGLAVKMEIGREMARSLKALRQPVPRLAVLLRYPFKLGQLASSAGGEAPPPFFRVQAA